MGFSSKLADEQIANHFSCSDPDSDTKGGQVERRAEHIGETKGKHGWDPALSKLERPAAVFRHHVLLDRSAAKMVH